MRETFATHNEALDCAEAKANAYNADYGIEYVKLDKRWIVRPLPSVEHSFGHDWTCERVRPWATA